MASRFLAYAVVACGLVTPAAGEENVSRSPVAAYRAYAAEQVDMLARMTRVLATDIRAGNLGAAQNEFASTHRYLERIRPLVRLRPELEQRMDASDDATGFRRIEHALYVAHSTADLAATADRLNADAGRMKQEVATLPMSFDMLLDGPAAEIDSVSARALSGDNAPYAKTGLWDLEAGLDGAQAMVAALKPRDPLLGARISAAFAKASKQLAAVSEGCGYKSFDALTSVDKAHLREATASLSRELAKLKTTTAID